MGRLKIADFMMIPVQRLTKYELLIEKIYQFTEDETTREQISLIVIVFLFVCLPLKIYLNQIKLFLFKRKNK